MNTTPEKSLIPYDDRDGWIWLNGKMVPWREAQVHVLTHCLHYGSGVFEGARAYGGKIFKCEEHTTRLFYSANALRMKIPFTEAEINKACYDVLKINNLTDGYLRPFAWRGPEQMGIAGTKTKTHVAVAAWFWPSYFSDEERARGLKLMMAPWRRPAPDSAPFKAKASGLYVICTLSKQDAESQGYDDALMLDYRGQVAEAPVANIFFVKDGKLHTPAPDCFLNGITRQTVIEIAKRKNIEVIERAIWPEELGTFEQAFLTGTAAEIAPVGQIAEHKYKTGGLVQELADEYTRLVRA